ncbi:MAG: pilus assembly protein [Sphingomonadales bacterium]|nr:pilus assembly protein [Sphingomonadales bacterium]MDE2567977.1 pilus assembly protein [Sphingomonadales bacterium]
MFLIGLLDMGQSIYGQVVLDGAVAKAARSSSLETANTAAADAEVATLVGKVLPGAQIASKRESYYDFGDVGRPEKWNDANNDGTCSNGEVYVDENGNGQWDSDIGVSGNGGANDVVVYTVTATYDPLFKVPFIPQLWSARKLTASTITKNQPFANQDGYGSNSGTCP